MPWRKVVSWCSKLSVECDVIDEFILQKGHRIQLRTRILLFGDSCHSNSRDSYKLLQFNRKVIQKHSSDSIDFLLKFLGYQTLVEESHSLDESHSLPAFLFLIIYMGMQPYQTTDIFFALS